MHEEYKQLMNRQRFSSEAELLEKLQHHTPKKRLPAHQKVLIIVLCLCLLIPAGCAAAEMIFDQTSVKIYPGKDFEGNDAVIYDIDFGTVKELPLSGFSEKWRHLEEDQEVCYESWAEAQEDMGLDLIENTLLGQEYVAVKAFQMGTWRERKDPSHCYVLYRAHEGQLYSFSAYAVYKKAGSLVYLNAEGLVEHPNIPEEVKKVYTGDQYILKDASDAERFHSETYTAASGLVATIVADQVTEDVADYYAIFRANGITYRISSPEMNELEREVLIELLEAFTF